jgi:segregation and condensation protein A
MAEKGYQVTLELFEGPLDLLLFLVKKDDLDIHNIPIAHITKEYLGYLDLLKEFNLEIAGEFLVMAATLMAYKSRALLPSQESLEDEGPDPTSELAQKLLEYQKFKEATKYLTAKSAEMEDVFFRGAPHFEEADKSPNLSLFELMDHIRVILADAEDDDDDSRQVHGEEFPIEEKMEKILFLLSDKSVIDWEELFADERKRRGIIACFLAMLELTKLQKIFVRQDANFHKIRIFKKETSADEETPVVEAADAGNAGGVADAGSVPGGAVAPDGGSAPEPGGDAEPRHDGGPDVQS